MGVISHLVKFFVKKKEDFQEKVGNFFGFFLEIYFFATLLDSEIARLVSFAQISF